VRPPRSIGERERDLATIESEAYRKVQELEGTADAKATEIYAKAYNQTPDAAQLFEFKQTMEAYKKLITSDTTMVFTTDSELFQKHVRGMKRGRDAQGLFVGVIPCARLLVGDVAK
jgi:regulator of protease activity HflC (stomatin/prohibitin superfamily)